jgi:ketosteroid isomerase-like protein
MAPQPTTTDATAGRADPTTVERNLATFDRLDFGAWNGRDFDLFGNLHAEDVRVVYPDGTETRGIQAHEAWAKAFFAAFDSRIPDHPIKVGQGDWTSVVGDMTVTFARPLRAPGGGTVPPTHRTWTGRMCTVARWKDGRIVEEHLFWDNLALREALGLP